MPAEPRRPASDECCHSGCQFCVQDLYEDELDRYRAELAKWRERHPDYGPARRARPS
ncbi:oxidoreductase-like domain-containing protein [Rugamonas sp.]|uniref:oxidoreductase-like domain-containing protein n=1 Tax=Rugamonas sp. TaxID=1926287 RepID=UPI0025DB43C0|nr:oxidoreductase-like domain-containing protein [Rugamonas sp.]